MTEPFSGWSGPRSAKLVFVAEAWGREEDAIRRPLVGESGKEFWRMLGEAIPHEPELHTFASQAFYWDRDSAAPGMLWTDRREEWLHRLGIAFTNVLNLRPPENKIAALCVGRKEAGPRALRYPPIEKALFLREEFFDEVERLEEELRLVRPNLVVCLGNKATWAILRQTGIESIRGAITLRGGGGRDWTQKVLPTYHPANILYNWPSRPILVADLMKAWRQSARPDFERPKRRIIISPTLDAIAEWGHATLRHASWLSVDTETRAGQIKCVSFARAKDDVLVIPFWDPETLASFWPEARDERVAWDWTKLLLESDIPKGGQNFLYDIQYFLCMKIRPRRVVFDSMMQHHALYPEMKKRLGFLGSIYTDEPAWKLMRRRRPDTEKRDD